MFNYEIEPPMPLPGETHEAFVFRSKDMARRDAIYFATLEANIENMKHPYVETECTVVPGSKIVIQTKDYPDVTIFNVHSYYAGKEWLVIREKGKADALYTPIASVLCFRVVAPESNA